MIDPYDKNGEPRSQAEISRLEAEEAFNQQAADEEAERQAALSRQREERRKTMGDRRSDKAATYLPDIHRMLPQAPDAERGILSSLLLSPGDIVQLCEARGVTPEWFHLPAHSITLEAIRTLSEKGKPFDFITLTQFMRDAGTLDQVGGAGFITELFTYLPTAANAPYYLEVCWEKYFLREVIKASTELAARSYDEQDGILDIAARAEALLSSIVEGHEKASGGIGRQTVTIRDAVLRAVDKLSKGKTEETWGLSTGYPSLDAVARGLRGGNMIGIAGDTGSGKTSLALNIIHNVSVRRPDPVPSAIFSIEMDTDEVTEVLLQIGSGVNNDAILEGRATLEELDLHGRAAEKLARAPVTIIDDTEINIVQIRSKCRRMKPRPRVIVVDYAQLVRGSKSKYDRADQEIAEVSGNCKKMAGELGATVIVISQLNDDGKAAGSRSLPKDSNQWWIVKETAIDERIINCVKQRRGARDEVKFRFIGPAQKFLPKGLT